MVGSIRQRGERSWEPRVFTGRDPQSGRKQYISWTVRGGRRQAEKELTRLVAQVDDGLITASPATVGELVERWHLLAGLHPGDVLEQGVAHDRRSGSGPPEANVTQTGLRGARGWGSERRPVRHPRSRARAGAWCQGGRPWRRLVALNVDTADFSDARDPDRVDVPVLVALDTGHTIDADGRPLPTVVIDAGSSPAVADLARVHAVEGVGDIRTAAIRADDLLLLGIRVTVPVRAAFAIAFDVQRHRAILDEVIEHGSLVIAHTDPELAAVERPQWLSVDIDGPALARCVASE